MLDLWLRTLGDLRSAKILMLMAIPFVAAIILVSLLGYGIFGFFIFSDFITQNPMVLEMQQSMESAEETIGSIPLIGGILLWIIGIAVTVVAGILGFLLGSYLILIFAMIITGFMTDALVKAVRDLNYPGLEYQGHGSMTEMIWKVFKYALGMLLLFLVTIPMLFIPVVNIVWFWLLGFMFFRYSVVLDVGMVILPKDVYEKHNALSKWTPTSAQAGIFSLSLFPIMGLIVPVLAVIAQAHYFFDKLTESQANAAKSEVLTQQ